MSLQLSHNKMQEGILATRGILRKLPTVYLRVRAHQSVTEFLNPEGGNRIFTLQSHTSPLRNKSN